MSDSDLDYVTREGFNAFRINWIWEAAEPSPGHFEDGHFDQVVALNDQMAKYGIRTLIGSANNSFSSKFGGFGAPLWASVNRQYCTKPDEQRICLKNIQDRYLGLDGEYEAWDNFYDNAPAPDGVGVLTHFTRTWQRLAGRLKDKNNVFALDLFHEPAPGLRYVRKGERRFFSEPATFERDGLPPFYKTVADGVRHSAPNPSIYFQISNYWTLENTAKAGIHVPPHFSNDPNLGLSFHFGPSDLGGVSNNDFVEKLGQTMSTASNYARRADVALVVTGYRLAKNEEQYAILTDLLGSRFIPWFFYTYKGMPDPGAENTSLLIDPSLPASDANVKSARFDSMVVPYPQLVAGTPKSWSFDRSTKVVRFGYSTKPVGKRRPCAGADTEIFVPARHYPQGYTAEVTGGKVVSSPTSAWLVIQQARGAREVGVTIRPSSGSFTERPAVATGPSADVSCR
ncbi:cellulase family glycosylhydrolase [Novosphingobium sp. G106]|uniref:glycoside hydrolase family 5 protein n=1 Tax=Novosphingobium sp. G106 TaxID=2849500 RepID=UPI001C2D2408|nr:cellulase family glycosylhydrolase [Novosphingobium sp. G106]MBV1686237.1 cellulase family glycosylhydrolase [Novosphingobium sp. G106]